MTLEADLREETHLVGGIPLKEIPGVIYFVARTGDQVLEIGDLVTQDLPSIRVREGIRRRLMVKKLIHQEVSAPLIMKIEKRMTHSPAVMRKIVVKHS